jgi:hypothetical protein
MRQGIAPVKACSPVPTIVFHGDCDTIVHPDNGDRVSIAPAKLRAGKLRLFAGECRMGIRIRGRS